MDPPPTPRRRPLSAYYAPPSSPSASSHVERTRSPPPSPSSHRVQQQQRGTGRPAHQSHRSTSSLSSLAQLNLGGPLPLGAHAPPASATLASSPSLSRATSGWDAADYSSLRRSNSILTSSATPWGERTHFGAAGGGGGAAGGGGGGGACGVAQGGQAHGGALDGVRSFEQVQERTFVRW